MSTNNSSKLTLNDVYKELERLKINRANVTISQLSKIFNIDLEASTRIHEGLTISNKSMAYDYYDEVKEKVKNNDDIGALEGLNKAIELGPNEGLFYRERGYLKFLLKDTTGALSDLIKAKELGDEDPDIESVIKKCQQVPPKKKKEGCYIATSVYGSYDSQEVIILRNFRDSYLKQNIFGNIFIEFYYAVSPSFVKATKNWVFLNKIIKKVLDKLVEKLKAN